MDGIWEIELLINEPDCARKSADYYEPMLSKKEQDDGYQMSYNSWYDPLKSIKVVIKISECCQ